MMSELGDVNGIGDSVETRLRQQGIATIEELAEADPDEISVPTGNAATLVSRANQKTITSKSASDLLSEFGDTTYTSTGVDLLDGAMGGGWEDETVGMAYGKSGKGKTQLALSTITEAASEGTVVYVQTEMQSKSVAQRLADLAEDPSVLDNITFYEAYSVSDQFNTYGKIEEEVDDLELLVIDSFTAQFRMTDDFGGRESLSARSDEIGKHLRKVGYMARSYSCPVILTGQVYPQPEQYGKGDKLWGGEKLRHFVSYFVRMSSGQGELVKATLENHPGRSEEEVLINITGDGLDGVDG
jgi:DNA repair protein RAD51/DNA repair protein RadA